MPELHTDFNPATVSLAHSNLIEASAGTGKTYSIALLAVRLVLERSIPLEKILMVTFTRAAAAELELRVRHFIRQALRMARAGAYSQDPLGRLLAGYCAHPDGRSQAVALLAAAQVNLDRLQVSTIHSFCQQVMREYAFETGQVFGFETLSPEEHDRILADAFHEYWRQHVTVLDRRLLRLLLQTNLSRREVLAIVKQGIDGKVPAALEPIPDDFLSSAHQQQLTAILAGWQQEVQEIEAETEAAFEAHATQWRAAIQGKKLVTAAFGEALAERDWQALRTAILQKQKTAYTKDLFGPLVDRVSDIETIRQKSIDFGRKMTHQICCAAFQTVQAALQEAKAARGAITFDDMIRQLSEALQTEAAQDRSMQADSLCRQLRKHYEAVFIDEFQDTDREQYYIFRQLFGQGTVLFYIGDPKQSIYGWRKADISTYFRAAAEVDHIHRMQVNWRSNPALISAMNVFFQPRPETDTFAYQGNSDQITYVPIASPDPNTKGVLHYGDAAPPPIRIASFPNKKSLRKGFLQLTTALLRDPQYRILEPTGYRPVKPSDIGILVRTNQEGRVIKELLARQRIPAVTIDDAKLLEAPEARELFYVLEAVHDITRAHINRALLTRIGGYDRDRLQRADEEAILQRFRKYKEAWDAEGVFVMLRRFLADHGVEDLFHHPDLAHPERTVSNILQLTELMHKVSVRRKYDARELLQWLKKGIDGEIRDGDEYQQRIESDEEAVRIVTIHKSKGLEYNIVVAPHLDFVVKYEHIQSISYRDPADNGYYTIGTSLRNAQQTAHYEVQTQQEHRRLLYVALTRARMACCILASEASYHNGSTLRYFRGELAAAAVDPACIDTQWQLEAGSPLPPPAVAAGATATRAYATAPAFGQHLLQRNWRRTSYTGLSPDYLPQPVVRGDGYASEYDRFVFQDIRRGAHSGNLIHYIFERIDFRRPEGWPAVIDKAIRRLSALPSEAFIPQMQEMLAQVLGASLVPSSDLRLATVGWEDRISELEFDFPLTEFVTDQLAELALQSPTPFAIRPGLPLEGIMNGKIDLVFRHGGKYWILDWKSNHLGDRLEDYSASHLQVAMGEHNYHLQYHIYSLALRRYLRARLPDFRYERDFGGCLYLFVRGVRIGAPTGVFFHKPDEGLLDRMEVLTTGRQATASEGLAGLGQETMG